jgi:hypothetical protein
MSVCNQIDPLHVVCWVSPTPFQIQYWLFGMAIMFGFCADFVYLFAFSTKDFALFASLFAFSANDVDFITVVLFGLFFGSLIGLLLAVLPWYIPAITFMSTILYANRRRVRSEGINVSM